MFHTRSTLIEDINFIVSRIIRLNNKLGKLRREHKHDRGSLPSDKTSAIRCTKCEGYGHENYQCPNWDAKYMTLQELQDYIVYLKKVKRSVRQKLEVKREQEAKREWEKARQERELKEEKELEMREEEQREKHKNESLLTHLKFIVEMKSLEGDDNALNCGSHSHHDLAFSLGTLTNPSLFVLMPREDLYIKEQWHKQWGEEKMMEKAATTWAKHEPDFNHLIVCLASHENTEGFQGHSFSILIIMGCSPCLESFSNKNK